MPTKADCSFSNHNRHSHVHTKQTNFMVQLTFCVVLAYIKLCHQNSTFFNPNPLNLVLYQHALPLCQCLHPGFYSYLRGVDARINKMEKTLLEKIDSRTLLLKSCLMSSYLESTISDSSVTSMLDNLWVDGNRVKRKPFL